jgi:hypothetical protein
MVHEKDSLQAIEINMILRAPAEVSTITNTQKVIQICRFKLRWILLYPSLTNTTVETSINRSSLGLLLLALPTSTSYQDIRERQNSTRLGKKKEYVEK